MLYLNHITICRYFLYYCIQFSVLWKDDKDGIKCSCGSWNLTEVMLFSLETENEGYCKSSCHSQMCGVYGNGVQAVQVFSNAQYELLIRNCDDLFIQPILPYKESPYPIKPLARHDDILVRKSVFILQFAPISIF